MEGSEKGFTRIPVNVPSARIPRILVVKVYIRVVEAILALQLRAEAEARETESNTDDRGELWLMVRHDSILLPWRLTVFFLDPGGYILILLRERNAILLLY